MMRRSLRQPLDRGFSLVELMVGIVVAMAAVIVVTQVFKISEAQRRTTTGGDDAQTTGAIAMSVMQRDLRQAGQSLLNPQLLGCQLRLGNGQTLSSLVPVSINPAGIPDGDDDTDVVVIAYGSGAGSPEGVLIVSQPLPATYSVAAPQAFQIGDRVVAAPETQPTTCALDLTSVAAAPVSNNVQVALGMANASTGTLFNLGRTPRFVAYAVRSGRLTACDFLTQNCTSGDPSNWSERVEYAKDTTARRDGTAESFDQVAPTTANSSTIWCGWSRVVGVRFVLVARNRQAEKATVVAPAPSWAGSSPINLGSTYNDWQLYRYKTFETTVPLRNAPGAAEPGFTSC
jgi:type IV pilus assembly protein PilW